MNFQPLPRKTQRLIELLNQIIRENHQRGIYITKFHLSREYWKLLNKYPGDASYRLLLSKTDENSFSGYFHIYNDISIPFTSKLENLDGYLDENTY